MIRSASRDHGDGVRRRVGRVADAGDPCRPVRDPDTRRALETQRAAVAATEAAAAEQALADYLAALERDLRVRPVLAGFFGKQQRQYDDTDPAGLGRLPLEVPRLVDVPAFFDSLLGVKGGVAVKLAEHVAFAPAVGAAVSRPRARRPWWDASSPSHTPSPRPWHDVEPAATLIVRSSSTATASPSAAGARRGAPPVRGVVARIFTGPHDANRQDSHPPMRYDHWSAEGGHPIEDFAAEDHLTRYCQVEADGRF